LNVDLIIATSLFVIFISSILIYISGYQGKEASWQFITDLRREANKLTDEIISQGNPPNWNKENVIPSKIGLASSAYSIPILVSDNSGYERINEPIVQEIVFDEDCKNIAWNGSVRIFDENFNEVPFRFVNQTFCPSGFLQKAILFFEVNVSANSTRKLQIFFYNSTQVNPRDYGNFSSLVMWLTFDEGSGNIAYDYSGNKNNGTLYNGTNICGGIDACPLWVDGKYGRAVSFDGINDYILIGNSTIFNAQPFTAAIWINYSGGDGYKTAIHKGSDTDREWGILRYTSTNGGQITAYIYNSTNSQFELRSDVVPELNRWYYTVLTFDGSIAKLYIDSALKVSKSIAGPRKITVNNLVIGSMSDLVNFWNGTIDDVRIYNRALTDEEILSHYQQPLTIKIFPRTEVSLISFEKLEALRNISYYLLKDALQKGYNFRVEIYEK